MTPGSTAPSLARCRSVVLRSSPSWARVQPPLLPLPLATTCTTSGSVPPKASGATWVSSATATLTVPPLESCTPSPCASPPVVSGRSSMASLSTTSLASRWTRPARSSSMSAKWPSDSEPAGLRKLETTSLPYQGILDSVRSTHRLSGVKILNCSLSTQTHIIYSLSFTLHFYRKSYFHLHTSYILKPTIQH